ncbi:MAG TPA: sulfurtransferase-like selenium metabolism protein YedF [Anaerolineaceae bacterium]|nr:sulfurtransferase-like selenium metabolism protein YedF [Anaerolineaceae bacterium]
MFSTTEKQEEQMELSTANTVVLVTRNGMGDSYTALQQTLIIKYFSLLNENNILPSVICFYTDGVRLAVTGSPVLEQLKELEQKGVHLILCGTCLDYYQLANEVQVGIVGGMTDIIEAQFRAEKVISI